jgi:hypothetical protein
VDFELNPVEIDRHLARARASWLAWKLRERPGEAGAEEQPLAAYRPVTGLSLFRRLGELPMHDPLRTPLRRWVYRLAEQRIDQDSLNELEQERQREQRHADIPGRIAVSFAGMLNRALGDPPRRELWSRLVLQHAPPVSALTVELWQRRREVARRMGLGGPAEIESPVAGLEALAERMTATTRERMRELGLGSLADLFEAAIGADAPGLWPARLTPQRVLDYFRDGDLLRSLELQAAPLPASFGAASTCRALGVLGSAWFEALAPGDQPFVIAHDPYGLGRHEARALFAGLPRNARFAQRHLDVSGNAMPDLQRRLARIWLIDLALAAFRVRLRRHALGSEPAFREAFAELAHADLGLSLPRAAAGAVFALGVEDEQALAGELLAIERADALVEAHDEDWFRNPRAIEQLRAEARLPPRTEVSPERIEAALTRTLKRLTELLG